MYARIYENLTGYNQYSEKININREKIFNVKNYIDDGFEKVCDVLPLKNKEWVYSKINKDLMFSEHRSWVYFLVIDSSIVKCGKQEIHWVFLAKINISMRCNQSLALRQDLVV